MRPWKWTHKREKAALALAQGHTEAEAAEEAGVIDRTIRHWKCRPEFVAEVDRLSLMVGIASRAERLRIAMRVARKRAKDGIEIETKKDLLDWLKFAQSETDGAKLDLAAIFAAMEAATENSGADPADDEPDED
jgi:hypothetical protein